MQALNRIYFTKIEKSQNDETIENYYGLVFDDNLTYVTASLLNNICECLTEIEL